MSNDEIISMAKEAAQSDGSADHAGREVVLYAAKTPRFLERFAALVSARAAAIEREACAKVCDDRKKDWHENENYHSGYMAAGAGICAKKIRARGDKDEQ